MSVAHVIATVLLVAGVGLDAFAVLGLVVMRNAYDRLHYVGLAGYGALLVGAAVLVRESFSLIGDKSLATGIILLTLGPVVVHTTMRTACIRDRGDWRDAAEGETGAP